MLLRRRFFLIFTLLCLLALPISIQAQRAEENCDLSLDFDTYTNRGLEAYNSEDLETALAEARCAQAVSPDNPIAYNNVGYLLAESGESDEALENYAEALQLDPEYRSALLNRADVYMSLEQYESAIADYDDALELAPTADVYNLRGIAHFNREDFAAAEADFTEAMNLDAARALYVRNRASSRFQLERYDEAAEDYATAIRLDPDWEAPVFGRADALYSGQHYDEALAAYRDGIARFASSDSRDTRVRRISVIRSGALIDSRSPTESGAITADSAPHLIRLDQLEGESTGSVVGIAITPNGLLLASGDAQGIVSFWDAEGEPLSQLDLQGDIKTLIASPDGVHLAAVVDDQQIVLIGVGSQQIAAELDAGDEAGTSRLEGITFSPDGGLLAAVWDDGTMRLYDPFLRMPVGIIAQDDDVAAEGAITFSPNGRYLTVVVDETRIQLWDIIDRTLAVTWGGAEEAIHTLTFDAAGVRLYGGSVEALYYWNTSDADPAPNRIALDAPVTDIRFSPDELLVATVSEAITIFDANSMEAITELSGEDGAWSAIAFSPDGNQLIAGQATDTSAENPLVVFEPFTATIEIDPADYEPITTGNIDSLDMVTEVPLNEPRGVIWSADGETLFAGSSNGVFRFPLDGDSASLIDQPPGTFALREGNPIFQAVETGADGIQTFVAYDVEDFDDPLLRYEFGDAALRQFVYGEELIAVATHSEDGRLIPEIVRLPSDGSEPEVIAPGGTESLSGVAVRGDGVIAVAPRDPTSDDIRAASISLFNADGTPYASIEAPFAYVDIAGQVQLESVMYITFSPDGTLLAARGSSTLRVWQETEPGIWQAVTNIDPPNGVGSSQFSPSGQWLISRANEEVVIWHIEQNESALARVTEATRIPVIASAAHGSIRFNADETLIAIITTANTVQIWGVE